MNRRTALALTLTISALAISSGCKSTSCDSAAAMTPAHEPVKVAFNPDYTSPQLNWDMSAGDAAGYTVVLSTRQYATAMAKMKSDIEYAKAQQKAAELQQIEQAQVNTTETQTATVPTDLPVAP